MNFLHHASRSRNKAMEPFLCVFGIIIGNMTLEIWNKFATGRSVPTGVNKLCYLMILISNFSNSRKLPSNSLLLLVPKPLLNDFVNTCKLHLCETRIRTLSPSSQQLTSSSLSPTFFTD